MSAVICTNAPTVKRAFSPLAWLVHAWEVHRERHALANLDAIRLKDIGLTPDAAYREANRPIWDIPAHWN
ncbi:Uncharacterized conserved protein YjiS, DUF1127 family [Aliiroseovarius sediminilitoris]|uniref:Uncharacterized conserved protein YjiS, DUF1127 family n=1 Tax=Aliiroseovarius sediminilitoris TaxID=1173584 RepID=A0A1I0NCB8_9RHOB|nr:DUF1127 domain-containing protein [Aliiroseovarius sediminilitoris]SEV98696.1 Uncharacterized conserved protein YjiS, DUF1127 family [Aliiroseovarius sediminilitoris]